MKKEMKALTREEMKKVVGGILGTIWNCGGTLQCSATGNPATRCHYTSCTNTGTACQDDGFCD